MQRRHPFDCFEYFNIVDRVTMDGPDAKTRIVGTGPFAFSSWEQGLRLSLTRNPNYWRTGAPGSHAVLVNAICPRAICA